MVQAGVPGFWFIAIISYNVLDQEITKQAEGAVKFLTDIRINDPVLEKTYCMIFYWPEVRYFTPHGKAYCGEA